MISDEAGTFTEPLPFTRYKIRDIIIYICL